MAFAIPPRHLELRGDDQFTYQAHECRFNEALNMRSRNETPRLGRARGANLSSNQKGSCKRDCSRLGTSRRLFGVADAIAESIPGLPKPLRPAMISDLLQVLRKALIMGRQE